MRDDHLGAYAATCAYFLMVSFVPLCMIIFAVSARSGIDISFIIDGIIDTVPSGIKDYIQTITKEVSGKTFAFMPISILILLWSAAKVFHALTNGLNVISRVTETRGWFFLRLRSMLYVVLTAIGIVAAFVATVFGHEFTEWVRGIHPSTGDLLDFVYTTRSLFGYFGLLILFLFIYKFLPNCRYTFRSQLPGALIVSTMWQFVSFLMALYYDTNQNFSNLYGSLTGIVLAMMWLYFCCFFLLLGAELNRVIYEDPDKNLIVSTIDVMRDASAKRQQKIMDELDEYSLWKPISDDEEDDNETENRC